MFLRKVGNHFQFHKTSEPKRSQSKSTATATGGAYPASYLMGTRGPFSGGKAIGAWS